MSLSMMCQEFDSLMFRKLEIMKKFLENTDQTGRFIEELDSKY